MRRRASTGKCSAGAIGDLAPSRARASASAARFFSSPCTARHSRRDVGEAELVRARPCDDDEIDPGGQEVGPSPEALAAEPLHAVAQDGGADLARHDHPERAGRAPSRASRAAGCAATRSVKCGVATRCPVRWAGAKSACLRRRRSGPKRAAGLAKATALLLVDRRHEALAALAAAILEDLAAAARRHAGAEAVRACPADVVGLVGALHGGARKKAPPGPSVKSESFRGGSCWRRP